MMFGQCVTLCYRAIKDFAKTPNYRPTLRLKKRKMTVKPTKLRASASTILNNSKKSLHPILLKYNTETVFCVKQVGFGFAPSTFVDHCKFKLIRTVGRT